MKHDLGTWLILCAALGAFGCASNEPPPRTQRVPLSERMNDKIVRESRTFDEPAMKPASREATEKELRTEKPKPVPETRSETLMEQPNKSKEQPPHPASDATWGTVPWGSGPWGQ